MQIQGNHQFNNMTNNGQAVVMARKYDARGNVVGL